MAEQPNEDLQREESVGLGETAPDTSSDVASDARNTILPFSPDNYESQSAKDPHSIRRAATSENIPASEDVGEPSDTIRRKPNIVSQLQLKQLELRLDLKNISDQLAAISKHHVHEGDQADLIEDSTFEEPRLESAHWETIQQLRKTIADLRTNKEALVAEVSLLKQGERSYLAQIQDLTNRLETINKQVESMKSEIKSGGAHANSNYSLEHQESLRKALEETAELRKSERRLLSENIDFKNQLEELKSNKRTSSDSFVAYEGLRSKLSSVEKSRSQIKALLEEQLAINDRNDLLLDEANKHIQLLTSQNDSILHNSEKSIFSLRKSLGDVEAAKAELTTKVESLSNQLKDYKKLEAQLASEKESHSSTKLASKELESRLLQQQEEIKRFTNQVDEHQKQNSSIREKLKQSQDECILHKSMIFEVEKERNRLSELLRQKEQEHTEAQRTIDRVREELHHKSNDLEYSRRETAQQTATQKTLHEQLLEKNKEILKLGEVKDEEIHELHKELASLKARLTEMEQSHTQTIAALTDQKSLALSRAHKNARDEIDRLSAAHNEKEIALNETNVRLENKLLDLQAETDALRAEKDKALVQVRLLVSQKSKMDEHDQEISGKLSEAQELLREARLDAAEMRSKYERTHRAEEVLSEKLKQMEQTISGQAIKLQSLQNANVENLMQQAEEARTLSIELSRMKENFSRQSLQCSAIETQAQHINQLNHELEEKLQTLQNSEKSRQSQFESYLTTIYNREYEKALGEFEFERELLKQSLKRISNQSDETQALLAIKDKDIQKAQQDIREKTQQMQELEAWADSAKAEIVRLQTSYSSSQDKDAQLSTELEDLQGRLKNSTSVIARLENELAHLQTQLDEAQQASQLKAQNYKLATDKHEAREALNRQWIQHLLTIYWGTTQQLNSLIFTKRYFSKVYPPELFLYDLEKTPIVTTRTFRGAALAVLAAVKFRRALNFGAKKTVKNSEESISQISDKLLRER